MGSTQCRLTECRQEKVEKIPEKARASKVTPEDEIDALLNKYMNSRQPKKVVRKETSGLIRKIKRRSKEIALKKAEAYEGNPVVPVERVVYKVRPVDCAEPGWVKIVCLRQHTRFSLPTEDQA
eukprot:TRINITY_DN43758_c0_g1_i1.p2 TRINITY_DN43758_c0_g1~~TRINITY_DN43758_c0_g1_i1.p2  ORF type:complete len:123 (+),score=43.51 TRINITY_DN43758_c0_g1_i1:55-423(+)